MSGFYLMHRGWQENAVFGNDAYSRRDAFVWLIEKACFAEQRVGIAGKTITLRRGQLSSSLRFMARAWGWDDAKVRRFLLRLQTEKIIDAATDAGQTVITICNYDVYQTAPERSDAATDAQMTQKRRSSDAAATQSIKNSMNGKKIPPYPPTSGGSMRVPISMFRIGLRKPQLISG